MTTKQLILGGARSGKSTYAEKLAMELAEQERRLSYIATATAQDSEMSERIEQHRSRRNAQWNLIEEPLDLARHLHCANRQDVILIDCLTLWLSNCLHKDCWQEQRDAFLAALNDCPARVIMVSNEVGSGIVPMGELSRQFVDCSGWLHQVLAELCDSVTLIVAGLPLSLKGALR